MKRKYADPNTCQVRKHEVVAMKVEKIVPTHSSFMYILYIYVYMEVQLTLFDTSDHFFCRPELHLFEYNERQVEESQEDLKKRGKGVNKYCIYRVSADKT